MPLLEAFPFIDWPGHSRYWNRIGLPLMFNIILEQVPVSKIGMMMGVGTMIPAIAPAIGPTLVG